MKIATKPVSVKDLMEEMFEGMDKGFHRIIAYPRGSFWPAIDVRETDSSVIILLEASGADPENISVSVEGLYAKIEGSKEEEKQEKGEHFVRREIYRGSFSRIVPLPCAVKKPAEAEYEKGILRIVFPKAPSPPSEKLKVKIK